MAYQIKHFKDLTPFPIFERSSMAQPNNRHKNTTVLCCNDKTDTKCIMVHIREQVSEV